MKRILISLFVFILAFAVTASASARDLPYYFQVEKQVVNVFWNSDGSMSLDYRWTFVNQTGSHVIDFVDVGMPNYNFDMSTVKADVDGVPVDVSTGEYQGGGSGFAIVMGGQSIPASRKGTVHVYVGKITGVLYPDDEDEAYASAVFAPTYFGSEYVTGDTDFTMIYHLPPNIKPEEPKWHPAPSGFPSEPTAAYDDQNRVTYTWRSPTAKASEYYLFGSSFPRTYVPAEAILVKPVEPWIDEDTITSLCCGGFFVFMFIGMPAISAVQAKKRKMQYLPPKVSIEGHGIKRGLTAVESAILMEQPLDKVLTMILFGVIKKDAAKVVTRDPLKLEIASPFPEKLHEYEKDFLAAFKEEDARMRSRVIQDMMIKFVKSVSEKMKGFSRKETIDYYKSIMERAWQQIEAADTPEVKSQKYEEALEWTMLDRDYDDRTRRTFSGPIFMPHWWGHYDPTYRPASTVSSSPFPTNLPTSTSRGSLPGADFAAQMVTGVQTFSQKTIGNVNTFTEKITGKTNPPPPPSRSGGSGRSGGGCACACACAGCACACAGGGR
ncbi:MAG: hypothetical protein HY865_23130 [Chloroflexi bacterium]|nr:hypothetical protein [Chloroflexota bacterium]